MLTCSKDGTDVVSSEKRWPQYKRAIKNGKYRSVEDTASSAQIDLRKRNLD